QKTAGERGVVAQVPLGQPARLGGQPVQPLEAGLLERLRGAPDVTGHEVDGRAAAEEPGAGELGAQAGDDPLLPREAEPDEGEIRLGLDEFGADGVEFGGDGVEAVPRTGVPGDSQPWVPAGQLRRGAVGALAAGAG